MTALERAARALCLADGMQPDWSHPNPSMGASLWELYVPRVRAVLMAVREPGADAHNAGAFSDGQAKEPSLRVRPNGVVMVDWKCADPSKMFSAMIDAILNEKE